MRIITHGIKGYDVDVELGHLNLICGANRQGKSTIADSLIFAILGHLPRLGKTEDRTAILMRETKMVVEVSKLLGDHAFQRTLELTDDGKLRGSVNCSWVGKAKANADEHNVAILQLFGAEAQDAIEALDIRELIKLTGNQRLARVQVLLEADIDSGKLAYLTARYTMQRLAGVDDDRMPEDHTALRPLIPGYDKDGEHTGQYAALREAVGMLKDKLSGVKLQGAAKWANDEKNAATRGLRPATQAREKLAIRIQELSQENPDELTRLEDRRSELERQIGADEQRRAETARKRKLVADASRSLSVAQTNHSAALAARSEYEAHGQAELATKREALAQLEREGAIVTLPEPPDETEPARMEEQAMALEQQAGELRLPEIPTTHDAEARVRGFEDRLAAAQQSPWVRVDGIAEQIDTIVEKGAKGRPHVRDDVRALTRELAQLAAANLGDETPKDLEAWLADARAGLEQLRGDVSAAKSKSASIQAQQQELRSEAGALRTRAKQIRTDLRREYQQARSAVEDEANRTKREISSLRTAIAALEARERQTAEAVRAAAAELESAERRVRDIGPTAVEESAEATTELENVKAQIAALQAAATTRREFARLVAEIDQLRAKEIVFKALERALLRVREKEVTSAGGPLMAHMRRMLQAAGLSEEPYIAGADLGWRTVEGASVSVNAMSGSEYTIFLAALASAILTLRGAAVRILIVEAAECRDIAPEMMLTALLQGIRGVGEGLTYALALSPDEPAEAVEGWTVIRRGRERQMQAA